MARQAIAGLHRGSARVGLILHSLQDRPAICKRATAELKRRRSPAKEITLASPVTVERGVSVSLAWGCAELLYRGSSPDMKKENCGVKRSAKTVCRANKQKL
ncbi:hypothetical protein T01_10229 [Trichinella spiralis]|uniref:Uncharacterized protein n=1 Tax=Trichinella spiralis TaxID=6334 RepID=A0A0V1B6T0_TRISP|nr:hypothetical protein T01_10229 [Trichinella spiralis]